MRAEELEDGAATMRAEELEDGAAILLICHVQKIILISFEITFI
tara:strand:+ start:382 stop:513 length:132 start_codon:yes stop_codon:yes gene_type:complete